MLAEFGVKLIYLERAEKAPVDGAAWQAFVKRGEVSEQDLVHFAGQIRMHPAIPFARLLQGRTKPAPQVDIDRTIR